MLRKYIRDFGAKMADGGYYEPYGSNVDNPAGLMPSMGSYRGDPGYGKLDNFQLKVMG